MASRPAIPEPPCFTLARPSVLVGCLCYLPLTLFERIYWNVVEPAGSPYLYELPPPDSQTTTP
jgi:hypothetical protein